jgi:hypothetical protein
MGRDHAGRRRASLTARGAASPISEPNSADGHPPQAARPQHQRDERALRRSSPENRSAAEPGSHAVAALSEVLIVSITSAVQEGVPARARRSPKEGYLGSTENAESPLTG